MAHVAHEMQRLSMKQPLLIGGATTSRVHTAVKIAPHYGGVTVYVPDASRAVGVASSLLSDELRSAYVAEVAADYEKIRVQHAGKKGPTLITLAAARANAFATDWKAYAPPVPRAPGRREFRNVDLAEIARFIDWGPFFQAWELSGPYPAILDDPVVGEAARNVHRRRQAMLAQDRRGPLAHRERRRRAVAARTRSATTSRCSRRARRRRADVAQPAPAERAAARQAELLPCRFRRAEGLRAHDYLGAFAVTAGLGIERKLAEFERAEGRLQRDHAEGARRPPRRSVRRMAARARCAASCGVTRAGETRSTSAR